MTTGYDVIILIRNTIIIFVALVAVDSLCGSDIVLLSEAVSAFFIVAVSRVFSRRVAQNPSMRNGAVIVAAVATGLWLWVGIKDWVGPRHLHATISGAALCVAVAIIGNPFRRRRDLEALR